MKLNTHVFLAVGLLSGICTLSTLVAQDVTSQVVKLGATNTHNVIRLERHRDRIYIINGAQSNSAKPRYYCLTTNTFGTEGANIPVEKPYGAVVKQGDLLWYGEDTVDGYNGSVLYLLKQDGWKRYQPSGSNPHQQSQWIYDGKIFLANKFNGYPAIAISENGGKSYLPTPNLLGQNGFAATINGQVPTGFLTCGFFEFRGNLFSQGSIIQLPVTDFTAKAHNLMSRYTGDPASPWELTYDRMSQLGWPGFTENSIGVPGHMPAVEFKGFLFLEHFGLLNRLSGETVTSKYNSLETYQRPANPVQVAQNAVLNTLTNERRRSLGAKARHGFLYYVHSTLTKRVFRRSHDGINFITIAEIDVTSGSTLAAVASHEMSFEVANGDIYFAAGQQLYKIPASAMGANFPSGSHNNPPVANHDSFSTTSVADAFLGPLRNDSDPDGDAFYAELVEGPSHGTLLFNYNGTFEYVPSSESVSTDSFTYRLFDGYAYSSPATVTISVPDKTKISSFGSVTFGDDHTPVAGQDGTNGGPSSIDISENRLAATLTGNTWKYFPLNYTVTANTMLEVTVTATDVGEIIGVILDNDTNATVGRRAFIFGGSQYPETSLDAWGWKLTPRLLNGSVATTYTIPVGTYFTGSVSYLGLIADDDATPFTTNVTYSNLRLFEDDNAPTVIYTEPFTNTTAADASFVSRSVNWSVHYGTGASSYNMNSADNTVSPVVSYSTSSSGTVPGFLFHNAGVNTSAPHLYWTSAGSFGDVSLLKQILFDLRNESTTEDLRVALQIGGNWFVSQAVFNNTTANTWTNNLSLNVKLAAYNTLNFAPGSTLGMGVATTLPTTGTVTAIGFFDTGKSNNRIRIDNVRVLARAPEPTPYEAWSANINWGSTPEAMRAPDADANGNGYSNFMERALGGNPVAPGSRPEHPVTIETQPDQTILFTQWYQKGAPELIYQFKWSTSLLDWFADGVTSETFDSASGRYFQSWTAPAGTERAFGRLEIFEP